MSFHVNADGTILNSATGKTVAKDITDPVYQAYMYWQQSGVNLTAQPVMEQEVTFTPEVIEEVVEKEVE